MSSKSIDRASSFDATSGATSTTEVIHFEIDPSTQTITVDVTSDTIAEPNEAITITASNSIVTNSIPSCEASIAETTILDDEILEILSFIQLI